MTEGILACLADAIAPHFPPQYHSTEQQWTQAITSSFQSADLQLSQTPKPHSPPKNCCMDRPSTFAVGRHPLASIWVLLEALPMHLRLVSPPREEVLQVTTAGQGSNINVHEDACVSLPSHSRLVSLSQNQTHSFRHYYWRAGGGRNQHCGPRCR